MEHSNFYVYGHFTNSGRIYYIGKGKGNRLNRKKRTNNKIHNYNRVHYGCNPIIIIDNLSEKEAFKKEIELVAYFKKLGYILANQTNGGEGVSGYKASIETRTKISKSNKEYYNKGGKVWSDGLKFSEEHKEKLSKAHKGIPLSDNHKNNMSKAIKDRYENDIELRNKHSFIKGAKPFICIQTNEVFINKSEASKIFNINRCTLKNRLNGIPPKGNNLEEFTFKYL